MKKHDIYVLDFYKKHDAKAMEIQGNEIVFGKYEDLTIEKIDTFEKAERLLSVIEFDKSGQHENNYPVSSLVLFSLENEGIETEDNFDFCTLEGPSEYMFQSVSLISFESVGLDNLVKKVKKLHDSCAVEYKDLKCFCFGTFGAYNLCIFSRAKRISVLVDFVNSLSKIFLEEDNDSKIFLSYTLLSCLGCQDSSFDTKKMLGEDDEAEYIANIQITCTNRFAAEDFLSHAKKILGDSPDVYSTLGEYDICIHIPINKLPISLYLNGGILNSYSPFYESYVLQSCTRISKKEEVNNFQNNIQGNLKSQGKHLERSKCLMAVFEEINNSLNDLFLSRDCDSRAFPTNLKRMFNIVNLDFRRAFSLAPESYFAKDLRRLFLVSISYANMLFSNSNEKSAEIVHSTICDTAKLITDAAYNMIQANDYTITEPYSFLYNSSICQSVKQSYLGFIKLLLVSFYENCGKDQSEIIPVVVFDPKLNVMKSDIYMSLDNGMESVPKNSPRIVSFRLPFDAIYNVTFYIPLLVHEVMHFFCPKDRKIRNKTLFKLYLKVYFTYMTSCLYSNAECGNIESTVVSEFTNDWVEKNFDVFLLTIESGNVIDLNEISMTFSKNLEEMFNQSFSKYGNDNESSCIFNFYFEFLKNIGNVNSNFALNKFGSDVVFKTILEKVKDLNETSLKQSIILNGRNMNAIKVLNSLSQGMKEIISDIMMVNFLELRMESYFAILIMSMYSNDLHSQSTTQQIIRLGYMVHFYGFPFKKAFKFDSKMKNAIINIIRHINPLCGQRCNNFEDYFSLIENSIEDFRIYHKSYLNDMDKIVDCYSIFDYSERGDEYDSEIRDGFDKLNYIVTRIKNTYNFYWNENNQRIPVNFIARAEVRILQMLRHQCGLDSLNVFYEKVQSNKKNAAISPIGDESLIVTIKDSPNLFPLTLTLSDLGIERSLGQIRRLLTDSDDEQLWYRGHADADWSLSPSLLRKSKNYRSNLVDAYEQFRAQACESLEIHSNIATDADWIAFMQHYFVPTHFLDWSEQPLTSLYFALENYFDNPCKFSKDNIAPCGKGDYNYAALFVLNPIRMNNTFKGINGVPNISISYNEKNYRDYILTNREEVGTICIKSTEDLLSKSLQQPPENHLPLAVITSQLSSRIKAQQGHFVTFNLKVDYDIPDEDENRLSKIGEIICLYNIQKEMYSRANQEHREFKPFLIKLIIPKHLKEDVALTVKNYGIKKSNFYPELMNIGSDISRYLFK